MLGYLDEPEETAHALRRHADGRVWLHTGDLGCMDADGFLYFRQRLKRIIVTSGYNVYPSQVENVLDGHEAVQLSCVIGVRDAYKMQRVRAYVVLKPGVVASEALGASCSISAARTSCAMPRRRSFSSATSCRKRRSARSPIARWRRRLRRRSRHEREKRNASGSWTPCAVSACSA